MQAQLQFFSYVKDGATTKDIKPLFSAHYDTVNAGPKLEQASYEKICRELRTDVEKVTFLTDNVKGTYTTQDDYQLDTATIRSIFPPLTYCLPHAIPLHYTQHLTSTPCPPILPNPKQKPSPFLVYQKRPSTRPRITSSNSKQSIRLTSPAEAEAATAAGVYAVLVDRPGNAPLSAESESAYPVITSLSDLPVLS